MFTNTLPNVHEHLTECSRTPYRMFTNTIERTRHLFMFVHLSNRMKFLVHVRSFIKQTNINELPAERFTNCSLNVRFVYSPSCFCNKINMLVIRYLLNIRKKIIL
ncbi:hypothetical protein Hanom_Chr17g01577901 [Helianthus anomalus]